MNEAENLMKNLNDQSLTIDAVADAFVVKFPQLVYELSKVIDRWFNKSNLDKKNTCIELVCQILKKSAQSNCKDNFVKGLSQRLRYFLQDLSRNYVSEGVALNVGRNIDSLKFKDLFCDEYFEKLQQLAKKIKENSNPSNSGQFQNTLSFQKEQKSYTKTFLKEYEDISNYPELKAIYDTFVQYSKFDDEVSHSKINQSDIEEISSRFDDTFSLGGKSYSDLNMSNVDGRKEKLEQIIQLCHTHMLQLRESMREEMNKHEDFFGLNSSENKFQSQNSI